VSPACRTPNGAIPPICPGKNDCHTIVGAALTPGTRIKRNTTPSTAPTARRPTPRRPTPRRPTGGFAPLDASLRRVAGVSHP